MSGLDDQGGQAPGGQAPGGQAPGGQAPGWFQRVIAGFTRGWTGTQAFVVALGAFLGFITGGVVQDTFGTIDAVVERYATLEYWDYEPINDRITGSLITVEVPTDWRTSTGEELYYNDEVYGPAVLAAWRDTVRWWPGYEDSGLYLGASDSAELINLPADELMQRFTNAADACSTEGLVTRQWKQPDRPNQGHKISYRVWSDCGENGLKFIDFVAKPKDEQYVVVGLMSIAREGDWLARARVFDSLAVDPAQFQRWKEFQTPDS